ncbi:MAG: ribonuclease [Pseudomonadota bacterium]
MRSTLRGFPVAIALWAAVFSAPAQAELKLEGQFLAEAACPATTAIRKPESGPEVLLDVGTVYNVVGINRANGSHYRIKVPGAVPKRRWVAKECGRGVGLIGEGVGRGLVLAVSWLPTFCLSKPARPECRDLDPTSSTATAFALHGLWPQPRDAVWCGVSVWLKDTRWSDLPEPEIDRDTAERLPVAMPGVASGLHRYQWAKHGSCYGAGADEYFDDAMVVLDPLNASEVRMLFTAATGTVLTASRIRAAFDIAFGVGTGKRVAVVCDKAGRIAELRLALDGDIAPGVDPGALMLAADPVEKGCLAGEVAVAVAKG